MVKQIYKSSNKVLVQSEAFISSVIDKGVTPQKSDMFQIGLKIYF